MKVLLLINSFNLGGAEKLIYDLANYLDKKKNINVVVCSIGKITTNLEKEMSKELRKKGIKVVSLEKRKQKDRIKCIFNLYKLIKNDDINLIHTNGQSPDFFGRIMKLFFWNLKIVVTVHNDKGYSRKIEKVLGRVTDRYISISPGVTEYMRKSLSVRDDIIEINNSIEIERYICNENKNNKNKNIVTVARVAEQKNYKNMIFAMNKFLKEFPEYKWTIIGDYDIEDKYFKEINNAIEVKGQVEFKGAIKNVEKYIANSDIFLLASNYEGFGIVFLEALATMNKLVVTKVGVINQFLENEKIKLYVTTSNYEDIYEALIVAEKDKNFMQDSKGVKEFLKLNYSLEAMGEKYYEIYKQVLM
ncbi:MAG: glycosyltransferase [Sarcina sp.]